MIREVVSDEEIGDIVSQWTGIPVSKLVETEREKLLSLSDILERAWVKIKQLIWYLMPLFEHVQVSKILIDLSVVSILRTNWGR